MERNPTVGIITLHYVDNHGGVLLAYALQEKIRQLGYDSQLIDYDPTPIPSATQHLIKTWLRRLGKFSGYLHRLPDITRKLIKGGPLMPPRHLHKSVGRRAERFNAFRDRHIRMTATSWTSAVVLRKSPPQLDAYVCGSDQIWNPFMCRPDDNPGLDPPYFLDFAPQPRRVSYAPSVSVPAIPPTLEKEFTQRVSEIDHLSCREESGAELIANAVGRPVRVVVDPVLLLTQADWRMIAKPPAEKGYLLCYFLGEGQQYRDFARDLSRRLGLKVKIISSNGGDSRSLGGESCGDIGPDDFLGLIQNAACICTDSFHGTLFSILFERPFFVFERPGSGGEKSMSSRIHNILGRLEMMDRLVTAGKTADSVSLEMDYSGPVQKLAKMREESIEYLRQSLAAATDHR